MNKIEEMIEKFCPEGVEYKELGEVLISLNTGLNPRKFFKLNTDDAENYYVTIREFKNGNLVFDEKTDKINDDALLLCNKRSNLEVGDVLFSGTGTIGETFVIIDNPVNWNIKEGVYTLKPKKEIINSKYLFFILKNKKIVEEYRKKIVGGTVMSVPMKDLKTVKIPIPPIEIQEKIVEILDKFTALTAELTAELTARKKQYEYYRDKLLTFGDEVEWKELGEVLNFEQPNKYIVKNTNYDDDFNIPVLTAGQTFILGYTNEEDNIYNCNKEQPIILFDDFTGSFHWIDFNFKVKSSATKILTPKNNNKFLFRYIYYCMKNLNFYSNEHKRLWISIYSKIKIPIPPLEKQKEIVEILDKFDSLCNSLTEGLPKEIELRQKQYEYYRDKLLSFKEKIS